MDTVQLLASLLDALRRLAERGLAAVAGVCHNTMFHIMQNILGCRNIAARWIPHEISDLQQWHRYAVAQDLLDRYQREGDEFLGRIVAMDETWAHSYEPYLKRQSNEWKHPDSPRPKKVRPTQSAVKATYEIELVRPDHAVPPWQMVNAAYYSKVMQHYLRTALRRKRRHLVAQNSIDLHDNARSHTAAAVTDLLRRWQWNIPEHSPY